MKTLKNEAIRTYKPKVITLNLKNQPTLIFDPSSPQLEWTVATQSQLRNLNKHNTLLSEETQNEENKLQEMYQQMVEELNEMNANLNAKIKSNKQKQAQLNAIQTEVNSLKSKYINLKVTEEEMQKLWFEYSNKFS